MCALNEGEDIVWTLRETASWRNAGSRPASADEHNRVNLSQELNSQMWDALNSGASFEDVEELYCDIAKLDVLSGIEIDKAKKEFAVDSVAEVRRLKKKYCEKDDDGRQIKPNFFGKIARMKGYYDAEHKNYMFHKTTMDFLQHSLNSYRDQYRKRNFTPFSELLVMDEDWQARMVNYNQIRRILRIVREMRSKIQAVWNNQDSNMDNFEKASIVSEMRHEYVNYVSNVRVNRHTAYRLLLAIEEPQNKDVARSLFYTLFSAPNQDFLCLLDQSKTPVPILEECEGEEFDTAIYDFRFKTRYSTQEIGENVQKIDFSV